MTEFKDRQEFDRHLYGRFPNLMRDLYGDMRETCLVWGVCCGRGWWPIIESCAEKLEALILQLPEEQRPDCRAVQIKEKYGSLRVYMSCQNETMDAAIHEAAEECARICEHCGLPGTLRCVQGWYSVQCQVCLLKGEIRQLNGRLNWAKRILQFVAERDCWFEKKNGCNPYDQKACSPCAARQWLEDVEWDEPQNDDNNNKQGDE